MISIKPGPSARLTVGFTVIVVCGPALAPVMCSMLDVTAWAFICSNFSRIGTLYVTTLSLALASMAVCLPIALATAFTLVRLRVPFLGMWLLLLAGSLSLPMAFFAAGWEAWIGPWGFFRWVSPGLPTLGGFPAALAMQVAWALPWCVGAIVMGLVGMERSLEESALLDAGTWTTIRTATLPQLRPSLAFAAVVAALPALTDMSATDLFQVRTLTEEIYTNLNESQAGERATVLALLPLAIAFSGAVTRTMPRKYRFESVRWQERLIFRWNPVAVMIAVLGFLGMTPLLLVFAGLIWQMGLTGGDPETARWSAPLAWSYFSVEITRLGPMLARELPRSLLVSASAVIIAFPLAWIVRCSGTHTRHLVLGFSAWLFVIPGPVIALGIIDTFQSPLLPSVLATWYGTSFPLIWGHTIKLLPLTTLALSVAMARLNDDMLENAEIAGAGFWSSAFRVAIPACEGPIVLSWIVGALYLLGELPTGKLLAPPGGEPVAIRLFALLHQGTGNRQAAAALVLGCVAMLSVGCLLLLIRSHRQRIAADP